MPRRNDIRKILLLGSGPIVIGQACEFDYSGTQGAKALTGLGYDVVLVNSKNWIAAAATLKAASASILWMMICARFSCWVC